MENNIMKTSSSNCIGTSFHGDTITVTPNFLKEIFGNPDFTGSQDDKTQTEWNLEEANIPFTLYDWKEYENFAWDREIEYHIGTHTKEESNMILKRLKRLIIFVNELKDTIIK